MDQNIINIIIAFLVLAGIAFGVYFLFFNKKKKMLSGEVDIEITPGLAETYDADKIHPLLTFNTTFVFNNTKDKQLINERTVKSFKISFYDDDPQEDISGLFGETIVDFIPQENSYITSTLIDGAGRFTNDDGTEPISKIYFKLTYNDGTTDYDWPDVSGFDVKEIPFGDSTDENIIALKDAILSDDPNNVIKSVTDLVEAKYLLYATDFTGTPSTTSLGINSDQLYSVNKIKILFKDNNEINNIGVETIDVTESGETKTYIKFKNLSEDISEDTLFTTRRRPNVEDYILLVTKDGQLLYSDGSGGAYLESQGSSTIGDDAFLKIKDMDNNLIIPSSNIIQANEYLQNGTYILKNKYYVQKAVTSSYYQTVENISIDVAVNDDNTVNIHVIDFDMDMIPWHKGYTLKNVTLEYSSNKEYIHLYHKLKSSNYTSKEYVMFAVPNTKGIWNSEHVDTELPFSVISDDDLNIDNDYFYKECYYFNIYSADGQTKIL